MLEPLLSTCTFWNPSDVAAVQDLFCELPPQPQAPPVFSSGARTAPAGAFGGGFPPRPPADHVRASYSAGGFTGGGFHSEANAGGFNAAGPAPAAFAGSHAPPGGFFFAAGGLHSAGNSLVSSGVLGSPEGSVRSAASEAAVPDPFSAFAPVMRAALPLPAGAAPGVVPAGVFAPAGGFEPTGALGGGGTGPGGPAWGPPPGAFQGALHAPSGALSASVPVSPATPAPSGFMAAAPWGGPPAVQHAYGGRPNSDAPAPGAPAAQYAGAPGFAGSAFGAAAAGPAFDGAFDTQPFSVAQPAAVEMQPFGAPHGAAFQAPQQLMGGSFAPPKSSGNPFA